MWLGIDFGTCYSSAAFIKDDKPTPVKFGVHLDRNITSLPSSVYLDEQGNLLVGLAAESRHGRSRHDPSRYRREFKRELGERQPLLVGGREMLPERLVSAVLHTLKVEAEKCQMQSVPSITSVVLTVPASYKKQKKELMRRAAEEAGFERVELLPEPVAAATYYAWRNGEAREDETTLVYDLGGGTFDAALIRRSGEGYESLAASVGHERLGGIDFDRLVGERVLAQCGEVVRGLLRGAPSAGEGEEVRLYRLHTRLWFADQCRELKEQLSWVTEAAISFPQEPLKEYVVTRDEFEAMIAPLIAESCDICLRMVEGAGIKLEAVDRVLLVGGSSRIPYVEQAVERELKRPVVRADDPDLAVCLGAAVHAAKVAECDAMAERDSAIASAPDDDRDVLDLGEVDKGFARKPAPARDGAANHAPPRQVAASISGQYSPGGSAYRAAYRMSWGDGKLEPHEFAQLSQLKRDLGLSPDEAAEIEAEFFNECPPAAANARTDAPSRPQDVGGADSPPQTNAVLAAGDLPLIRNLADEIASAIGRTFELKLTPAQRTELDRALTGLWQCDDSTEINEAKEFITQSFKDATGTHEQRATFKAEFARHARTIIDEVQITEPYKDFLSLLLQLCEAGAVGDDPQAAGATAEEMWKILKAYSFQGFYVGRNIPSNILTNARASYPLPADEEVFGLFDNTTWGSGKHGVVFGRRGFYYRGLGGTPQGSLPYAEFGKCNFTTVPFTSVAAYVDDATKNRRLTDALDNPKAASLLKMLNEIKRLFAGAAREAGGENGDEGSKQILSALRQVQAAHKIPVESNYFHVAPNIPQLKIANARSTYELPTTEVILGMFDNTAFNSGKHGALFGENAFYYRGLGGTPSGSIKYDQFKECTFSLTPNDNNFVVREAGKGHLSDALNSQNADILLEMLKTIQRLV